MEEGDIGETQLSPEEEQAIAEAIKNYGAPQPDEKHNIHTFLNTVSKSKDTTKTGFLSNEELGVTPYSERTYKNIELMSRKLCVDDMWADFYKDKAEILTATSLSRNAKLLNLAVLQKKELADVTEDINRKPNKGWFKSKDKTTGEVSAK